MSLQFFIDQFDADNSATINATEFGAYLTSIRGDDVEHCLNTTELFSEAGILETAELSTAELSTVLALSTECVLDLTCAPEFEIEVNGEIYECGDHDHSDEDDEDDDGKRRLSGDDDDEHDHGEGEEELEVHLLYNGLELECEHSEEEEAELEYGNYSVEVWAKTMGITIAVSLLSVAGAVCLFFGVDHTNPTLKKWADRIMALALGVLLYAVFIHLTYEALESLESDKDFGYFVLVGVVCALSVEFIWPFVGQCFVKAGAVTHLNAHAAEEAADAAAALKDAEKKDFDDEVVVVGEGEDGKEAADDNTSLGSNSKIVENGAVIVNILVGDFFHNFIDGILISLAFTICGGTSLGYTVTLGIVLHELPQELSDFFILMRCGLSFKQALFCNFLSATSAIIAAFIVLASGEMKENTRGILFALSMGILAFVTLAEVFPFVIKSVKKRTHAASVILFAGIGLSIGLLLNLLPHEHCETGGHDDHDH